jgi:hypothetical protein
VVISTTASYATLGCQASTTATAAAVFTLSFELLLCGFLVWSARIIIAHQSPFLHSHCSCCILVTATAVVSTLAAQHALAYDSCKHSKHGCCRCATNCCSHDNADADLWC